MTTLVGAAPTVRSDERRLLAAVAVSALGTWSYNVGIAVFAYQETQSAAWVAAATVGRYIPALFITSIGSRWADRRSRRQVASSADLACAALMLGLTVLASAHGSLLLAIGIAALSSGISRVQGAAALAMAADIVPESRLARAAATLSTTEAVSTAAGPALASLVLAVSSPAALFAFNALSFLASAALIVGIRSGSGHGEVAPVRTSTGNSHFPAVVRLVWPVLALRTLAAAVYGADIVLLAVLATAQLRQGTSGYGWLLAAAGVGGLSAALLLRRHQSERTTAHGGATALAAYALPLLVFLAVPGLLGSLGIQAVRGAGLVVVTAVVLGSLQVAVPSAVAGRVFGLAHGAVLVGTSAGAVAAPFLLDRWGLSTTLALTAIVPTILGLGLVPWLRSFDSRKADLTARLEPRVDVLRRLDLFAEASRGTLFSLAESVEPVRFRPADPVLRQGDDSDCLLVLVDGELDVYVDAGDGPSLVRRMRAPGYVGEIGLVHGRPRTASVIAASDVACWRIPGEAFLRAASHAGLSGALDEGIRTRLGTRTTDG